MDLFSQIENTERAELLALRTELEQANYQYYVLNAPTLSDYEFDQKLRRLQDLESLYPDMFDMNSPTQRVGSDLNAQESVSLEDGARSVYSLEDGAGRLLAIRRKAISPRMLRSFRAHPLNLT